MQIELVVVGERREGLAFGCVFVDCSCFHVFFRSYYCLLLAAIVDVEEIFAIRSNVP